MVVVRYLTITPNQTVFRANIHRFLRSLCLLVGILGLSGLPATASLMQTYSVTHTLSIKPNLGFGGEWQAGWRYDIGDVFAREGNLRDGPKSKIGQIEPFSGSGSMSLSANAGASAAKGTSSATASFSGGSNPFNGTVSANGFAQVNPPPRVGARAYAASSSFLIAGLKRTSSSGAITWNSISSVFASGGASAAKDPIDFSFVNPVSNQTVTGTLLNIDFGIDSGNGSMSWEAGILSLSSPADDLSGYFSIELPSAYTTEQGGVLIRFVNGIISSSSAFGIYSGLAPAVGSKAVGNFAIGEPLINYDFGFGDEPITVDFAFSNGGQAVVEVPEPTIQATLLLGIIGLGLASYRHRFSWAKGRSRLFS